MAELTRRFAHALSLRLACAAAHWPQARDIDRAVEVMGLHFDSPLGIAAGFDRCGLLGRRAGALGFGCNELGSFTLAAAGLLSLRPQRPGTARLGVNLSLSAQLSVAQLRTGIARAWPLADYLMLNLIGPGSTALLSVEQRPRLRQLLTAARNEQQRLNQATHRVPMAVKLRCLPGQVPLAITELLLELGYDGLLAAHDPGPPATLQRYRAWQDPDKQAQACAQIAQLRHLCGRQLALMSVGGVHNAAHFNARLAAGAELVQVHSVLLHRDPWQIHRLVKNCD